MTTVRGGRRSLPVFYQKGPENMNNDLISREALKKALKKYKYCGFYDKVIEIIDNAPTVEDFTENDKALAYCEGYVRGSHEAYIRPQGEWIAEYTESCHSLLGYQCSICFDYALEINEYPIRTKFCPHCGAQMKEDND